ncbi:uncharacterized protein [Periplaneta americana]|uniref:uncharacterized protein isoform X1 n=1 Tax=Periplaneta americana TaxID=6978 RepID=UPI0037E976D7
MLKWLAGSSSRPSHDQPSLQLPHKTASPEIITDDPLATICVHKVDRPLEIYAVSRSVSLHRLPTPSLHQFPGVNPLFDDGEDKSVLRPGRTVPKGQYVYRSQHKNHKDYGSPEFPGKSGSSGYDSNRYNSSSEYSSSGAEETANVSKATVPVQVPAEGSRARCGIPRPTILRDDAVTVLEQNVGFVKSILVAVRGNNVNASPSPRAPVRRHNRRSSGASAATLSPIPEGKVDYCIPRPVWPRHGESRKHRQRQQQQATSPQCEEASAIDAPPDSIVDDALLLYTSFTYSPPLPSDVQEQKSTAVSDEKGIPTVSQTAGHRQSSLSSQEILRELSETISQAMAGKHNASPEDVLKGISDTINLKLESLQSSTKSASSEEALRKLSMTLSHREPLTKMSRALSNSSSSSGGSLRAGPSHQDETDRRMLLERLGSAKHHSVQSAGAARTSRGNTGPRPAPRKTRVHSVDDLLPHRGSSSSSTSSSGFSDLTQTTPPSSSSDSPSSRRGDALAQPPVFLHENLANVPNSVRNAMIYGTLCRLNTKSGAYEKLLNSRKSGVIDKGEGSEDVGKVQQQEQDRSLWETYCGAGVTVGDVHLKTSESYYYSPNRPDFTLDMHRAERLVRKIKSAKRRRCWCRVVTSLLGLVFFLMSVMIVSMLLTRGKRVFGPI